MTKRPPKKTKLPIKQKQSEPKGRIRPQLKEAIRLMVEEAKTIDEAAQTVGYKANSIRVAMKKAHVIEYKNRISRAFQECETERSFARMVYMRDHAESERIRADMAKEIAGMEPRYRPAATIKHVHSGAVGHVVTPGYIIDLSDDPIDNLSALKEIDDESEDT